eukprot:CAMPEP_0205822244 /NCGR_PEP_ID=MMETSP0206-20130828/11743_1 /ASSEMBLY_ACC=CAM_ASM_000279 /TAXON_ID=36767 /ORGANISM="Euplotes focardii, Strain TN1" /LENGTH=82 /DNA_ID=CAMNT_0053118363 /DNA_START=36 /DNA_END=284 /DNA_ORIENTATION=-
MPVGRAMLRKAVQRKGAFTQPTRTFAGGPQVKSHGIGVTPPKEFQLRAAEIYGGMVSFWIMYRMWNDHRAFFGLEKPWEGHH